MTRRGRWRLFCLTECQYLTLCFLVCVTMQPLSPVAWRVCIARSFLLCLAMCVVSGCNTPSVRQALDTTLACKSFALYETEDRSLKMYDAKVPGELDHWYEVKALLRYHQTLSPCCYLYSLSYEASKSTKKDKNDQVIEHIVHLLKTPVRFLKEQPVLLRYAEKEPLLFEWIAPLKTCPDL